MVKIETARAVETASTRDLSACADFTASPPRASSLVELLRFRALKQPEKLAFTFLEDGETEGVSLTYQQLDKDIRAIAAKLQALGLNGERALLLYPPGLDYLRAFFGCLYAGVCAVPAYPPRNQRNTPRIKAVVADAGAAIALTTTTIQPKVQSLLAEETNLKDLQWLATDSIASSLEDRWQQPLINKDTLAFLQYTSGSTGVPKGVMLTHGNLLHNAAMTYKLMEHSPTSKFVSWLPAYHDMGLIGGILQPLYGGFPCILMPPASFLQRPYRWLKAISDYQATTSGGPNFAYELCTSKITPEQRETLDLSSWSVAFNGAEPIAADTLERFAATFADCGFRPEAFYPCYGLAEATLMVSGSIKAALPTIKKVQAAALESNKVVEAGAESGEKEDTRTLVSSGKRLPDQQIAIAHPETLTRCLPEEVGEIWVSGSSVGKGYWNRTEETEKTFRAYLADTGEGPFLRTGDLGFLQDGELFVTGRAKDVIIIRGRNLYPQDIELTAERSHPALRSGSNAAFTVEAGEEERLVVVQELEFRQKPNLEEVTTAIRRAVAEEHEAQVYAVVLIKPGSIFKTSSGKIQRRATRAAFLAGNLEVVGSSILDSGAAVESGSRLTREMLLSREPAERHQLLTEVLQQQLAEVMKVAPSELNFQQPLSNLGLDSLMLFQLKNRIEVDLGIAISVEDIFTSSSISQLATQVLTLLTDAAPIVSVLEPISRNADIPLSFAQERLWFLDRLQPGNRAYNIPAAVRLVGKLNLPALEQSFNEILRRHEALRTSFITNKGQPVQVIAPTLTLTLPVVDLQDLPKAVQEEEVQRLATAEAGLPFNLAQAPLLRTQLLQLNPEEHVLLLTMHHIVSDGWSMGILMQEVAALYESFASGKPSPLPELPIQYADFAVWQRLQQSEVFEKQLAYWKQQLGGRLPTLELPTDFPRPAVQGFRGSKQSLALPKALSEDLKALSQREGVTLFMTLLAAFQTLLYYYTGQFDLITGTNVANRSRVETESAIGFFVNQLVLRTNLSGNPTFRELLLRVREVTLGAYSHQDLPFNKLVETLNPGRDLSRSPLFQVKVVLENAPISLSLPGLNSSAIDLHTGTSTLDLFLSMVYAEEGLSGFLEYDTDLFTSTTISRMLVKFETLLSRIVAQQPDIRLNELVEALDKHQGIEAEKELEKERHKLLVEFNNTQTEYPKDKCIHQLFEAQVEKTPDNIAVVFKEQQLTYAELNAKANQLASYLQQVGVKPEVLVGVCIERSPEMVIAVLGILKAGGAYVPLASNYPSDRKAFILQDTQAPILLTQQHLLPGLPTEGQRVICLDSDWQVIAQQPTDNPANRAKSENLAYVMYTSGSTGKPKGTLIPHRGMVNYLSWCTQEYAVEQGSGTLVHSPLVFDLTITSLFSPLLVGCQVELLPEDSGIETLSEALKRSSNLSLVKITPAHLELLSQQLSPAEAAGKTRAFIIGGENLLSQNIAFWQKFAPETMLVNEYGPTETVVGCCIYKAPNSQPLSGSVPIGSPIANTELYVLDERLQLVPSGVPGELYIGGIGVARGYLNRPELTAEKFIPNLFSNKPGERLYKTGDLARHLPDGTLEYLGRIDEQVKIRGFRIELGEIEAVLSEYREVQEAVVVVREDVPGDRRLVAYIVWKQESPADIGNLRSFLKEKLPDYMVPTGVVPLEALPLTANGKINRRDLPKPDNLRPDLEVAYVLPSTDLEQIVATTWQQVLHLDKVGIHDNFFDLGGHSLLIVQVHSKLQEILQQDISVIELLQYPTIHSLAEYLSKKQEEQPMLQCVRARASKQKEARQRQKQLMAQRKASNN